MVFAQTINQKIVSQILQSGAFEKSFNPYNSKLKTW